MITYEIKQTIEGKDYLEMTLPDGTVSFVPMAEGNSDYENYLNPVEHLTVIPTE
jgi:hypothetical protein